MTYRRTQIKIMIDSEYCSTPCTIYCTRSIRRYCRISLQELSHHLILFSHTPNLPVVHLHDRELKIETVVIEKENFSRLVTAHRTAPTNRELIQAHERTTFKRTFGSDKLLQDGSSRNAHDTWPMRFEEPCQKLAPDQERTKKERKGQALKLDTRCFATRILFVVSGPVEATATLFALRVGFGLR